MTYLLLVIAIFTGSLSAYSKDTTVATVQLRQEWGQLPDKIERYDVWLSVPNCGLIGHVGVMIIDEGTPQEKRHKAIVFDCAGPIGHWWMLDNGVAAEVDYWWWMEWPEYVGTEVPVTIKIGEHWTVHGVPERSQ